MLGPCFANRVGLKRRDTSVTVTAAHGRPISGIDGHPTLNLLEVITTNLKMIDLKYRILFVCMGNICRSPTAEAVFYKRLANQKLLHKVKIDSAGTHNFHPDAPPDERSQMHALKRGYDMSHLRARQIVDSDFEEFDLLLTMDWDNRALLEERCPAQHLHKVRGLAEFLQTSQASVIPDPYYGGDQGFEQVLDLIEEASDGLMKFTLQKVQI